MEQREAALHISYFKENLSDGAMNYNINDVRWARRWRQPRWKCNQSETRVAYQRALLRVLLACSAQMPRVRGTKASGGRRIRGKQILTPHTHGLAGAKTVGFGVPSNAPIRQPHAPPQVPPKRDGCEYPSRWKAKVDLSGQERAIMCTCRHLPLEKRRTTRYPQTCRGMK